MATDKTKLLLDNLNVIYDFVNKKYDKFYVHYLSKEDMTQELILHCLEKIEQYNETYSITTFLYLVLNNYIASKGLSRETKNNALLTLKVPLNEYENYIFYNDNKEKLFLQEKLDKIIHLLSKETIMYYLQELTLREIAEKEKTTITTINARIKRNIRKIRRLLNIK